MGRAVRTALEPLGKRYVRIHMAFMLSIVLLAAGFHVYYASLMGKLAEVLTEGRNVQSIVYAMVAALSGVCALLVVEETYKAKIRCDVTERYQKKFSYALLTAQMADIRKLNGGDVYVRGTSNLQESAGLWTETLWKLASGICRLLLSAAAMAFLHPLFCIFLVIVIAVSFSVQAFVVKPMQSCRRRILNVVGKAETVSGDLLANLRTVWIEKAQEWAKKRYKAVLAETERQYRKEIVPIGMMMAGSFLCGAVPTLFSIFYPALAYTAGYMALSDCITVITLGISASTAFSAMPRILASFEQGTAALQRVEEIWGMADEKEMYKSCGSYRFFCAETGGELLCQIRNLTFGYAGEKEVVQDWSCQIERNRLYLLTGLNGTGKSTFGKLLSGLYLPESGTVSYFTKRENDGEIAFLRSQVVIAEQEPVLFAGSLFDNIRKGNKKLSEGELQEWYAHSGMREAFAQLAGGMDAPIEKSGSNLSGGQKKCISVSRALLSEAELVILDEPTANLSEEMSQMIYGEIARALEAAGKTILVITHDDGFEKKFPDARRLILADGRMALQ